MTKSRFEAAVRINEKFFSEIASRANEYARLQGTYSGFDAFDIKSVGTHYIELSYEINDRCKGIYWEELSLPAQFVYDEEFREETRRAVAAKAEAEKARKEAEAQKYLDFQRAQELKTLEALKAKYEVTADV